MWNHATPSPLLQRSLSTCNLALSLKERLQRHSLANSHGYLHPSTIISLLQFISRPVDRILKQLGMWNCSTTGSGWNMNVDVLWNKYHTCINFIHVAGLMQVQMPTWFNGNLHRPKIDLGFAHPQAAWNCWKQPKRAQCLPSKTFIMGLYFHDPGPRSHMYQWNTQNKSACGPCIEQKFFSSISKCYIKLRAQTCSPTVERASSG